MCVGAARTLTPRVCNKGCIVLKDKAVFQRSFPPPRSCRAQYPDLVHLKLSSSSAHFSILPHVQVLIKPVEGWREFEGCWVVVCRGEKVEVGGGVLAAERH